jgi:hypothetical protein
VFSHGEYHEVANNATPVTQSGTGNFRKQYLIDGALCGMLLFRRKKFRKLSPAGNLNPAFIGETSCQQILMK